MPLRRLLRGEFVVYPESVNSNGTRSPFLDRQSSRSVPGEVPVLFDVRRLCLSQRVLFCRRMHMPVFASSLNKHEIVTIFCRQDESMSIMRLSVFDSSDRRYVYVLRRY